MPPWNTSIGSTIAACTASWACCHLRSSKRSSVLRPPHRYSPRPNDRSLHATRGGSVRRTAERLDAEASDPTVILFPPPAFDPHADRLELTPSGEAYLRGTAEPPLA